MRFGFVAEAGDSPSSWYRCQLIARGLVDLGHVAWCAPMATSTPEGRMMGVLEPVWHPADVIVLRTWTEDASFADEIYAARRCGQIVLYDVDDDIWHLPAGHPRTPVDPEAVATQMRACNGVIVSTPELGEVVHQLGDMPPIAIGEPALPIGTYLPVERPRRPLRVVWLGTLDYRGADLAMIRDPLREFLDDWPAELHWLGCADLAQLRRWHDEIGLPVHPWEWCPVWDLPDALTRYDMAVIPARPTAHNHSRSATTGAACAAAGLAVVASALPSYQRLNAEVGAHLWIPETTDDWVRLAWTDHPWDWSVEEPLAAWAPERRAREWETFARFLGAPDG